jgi:hypothetical protein
MNMKYLLLVYLFNPSGEFLLKDVIDTENIEQCESMAASYAKTMINTQNQISLFCLTEDEYYNRESEAHN